MTPTPPSGSSYGTSYLTFDTTVYAPISSLMTYTVTYEAKYPNSHMKYNNDFIFNVVVFNPASTSEFTHASMDCGGQCPSWSFAPNDWLSAANSYDATTWLDGIHAQTGLHDSATLSIKEGPSGPALDSINAGCGDFTMMFIGGDISPFAI